MSTAHAVCIAGLVALAGPLSTSFVKAQASCAAEAHREFDFWLGTSELFERGSAGGDESRRVFEAMMPMKKIDVATIEAARRG